MDTPHWEKSDREVADGASLPDHYAALQVRPSASQQEIARAYRALMRNLHPDVDGGRPPESAAGKQGADRNNDLLLIMQAFAVLRDPGRRAAYDRSRARPQTVSRTGPGAQSIPVRHIRSHTDNPDHPIRITPVRWESGPWA